MAKLPAALLVAALSFLSPVTGKANSLTCPDGTIVTEHSMINETRASMPNSIISGADPPDSTRQESMADNSANTEERPESGERAFTNFSRWPLHARTDSFSRVPNGERMAASASSYPITPFGCVFLSTWADNRVDPRFLRTIPHSPRSPPEWNRHI